MNNNMNFMESKTAEALSATIIAVGVLVAITWLAGMRVKAITVFDIFEWLDLVTGVSFIVAFASAIFVGLALML